MQQCFRMQYHLFTVPRGLFVTIVVLHYIYLFVVTLGYTFKINLGLYCRNSSTDKVIQRTCAWSEYSGGFLEGWEFGEVSRIIRHDGVPGAVLKTLCGVCAAAVGSSRRPCRGPVVYCIPRPPPRFPKRLPRSRPARSAWSWALTRSSCATSCACSGTTPIINHGVQLKR